jgi:hypothetical protein
VVGQRELAPGHEDDLRARPAHPLGARGAVAQQVEHLGLGHVTDERRVPHLQAELGGDRRRDVEPVRIAAEDADRVAVQVVADDRQLPPNNGRGERLARDPTMDEPGVVADAFSSHGI